MPKQSPALDRMFSAIADPTRRRLVERLARGPASVSELARPLKMALPTVVQHLKVLEASGLMTSRKQGRVRTCRIALKPFDAAEAWLGRQRAAWAEKFDRFSAFVEEMDNE